MLSGTSMLVLIAGIIGEQISPLESLATLPIALAIIGVALNTLPAAFLMSRYGRKPVFIGYGLLGIAAALLAAYAMSINNFQWFCVAAFGIGAAAASVQQYRFAAIEMVSSHWVAKATSTILLGGILAAIIGPELSLLGKNLTTTPFVGSFFLLAAVYALGLLVLFSIPIHTSVALDNTQSSGRRLRTIFSQQPIILAILAAAIGYGVMSFIMTATPLSMHSHHGHSLEHTKWVIQSHVAAMYLPSLFSGYLVTRFGCRRMMAVGTLLYAVCLIIAYQWQDFIGFWLALVLLGIGWNFLFVAGTSLLASQYQAQERFKVQAINDFLVFGTQALAALSSGWLLFKYHWQGILMLCLLPLGIFILALLLQLVQNALSNKTIVTVKDK
ncbi:MAG: MFS transporter [Gammaproteobacteria bacterium]|nr:MFS transporter [Gammaproteobacteria bacterium]